MAKRGRKRKKKILALSSADKNHLSRILKKVRQIKENKAAQSPLQSTSTATKAQAQQAFNAAQNAYISFISRGLNLALPTNQNTLNSLVNALNIAAERLNAAR